MIERNSEKQMVWVVIAILGAQVLGIDVGQLFGLVTEAKQHADQITGSLALSDITLPGIVAIYAMGRTKLKTLRESKESASA